MTNFQRGVWIFTALALLLVLPSCMQKKSLSSPQPRGQVQKRSLPSPQTRGQVLGQARQHMTTGKYQKAIDLYQAEYEKHPQDRVLVNEYVQSLEEIKTAADRALNREDFASAGDAYNVLLKNYEDFKGFAHRLSFDRSQLNSRLANCTTALSRKGFQEYREGNLSEAISLWQDYLALDPHNTDIKKALNTAKTQQKNLQQTK